MGTSQRGRIVVVSRNHARTIGACLDALAVQRSDDLEVVVVDQDSTDGCADIAIHHPLPDRVSVVADGSLQRVVREASREARHLLLLRADLQPGPAWCEAALEGLTTGAFVLGPDRDLGNLALDVSRLGTVDLFSGADGLDDVAARARAAGEPVTVAPMMRVSGIEPAAATPDHSAHHLPVKARPPSAAARYAGLVSVVVCTRDRHRHLTRCLASLARLCDDDHEILVIDNHDVPTVDPSTVPARGRLVHEPRRGLDVARNRGIAEAAGAVITYIDDDCEADPHWLTALRISLADPEVGMVTGRVRAASLAEPTQRYFEAYFSFDRGLIPRRFTPWDDRPWFPLWTGPMGTGCNMAFRRDLLVEVGGFDELLDVGSSIGGGGDLDIFARLVDRGVVAEYTPDALVWHHHRTDRRALARQFLGYGEAAGAYLMKSVIERPGLRSTAVRFYGDRIASRVRAARDTRAGVTLPPSALLLVSLWGQLTGPFLYVWARARRRR